MKKIILFLALLGSFLVSCSSQSKQHLQNASLDKPKVLCTIHVISDIVQSIARDRVSLQTLIKPDLDPHAYELVKGDDEVLLGANLIFYNGLGLEHSPNIYRHLQEHPNSHGVGEYVQAHFPEMIVTADGVLDPHLWMDVSIWQKTVPCIVAQLSKLMPHEAEFFAQNARELETKMQQTHQKMIAQMQQIPSEKRYLITCHDAFFYFTKRYLANEGERENGQWKKRFIAPEGLAPDCQLSTSDLQKVIHFIQNHQVTKLFPEHHVNLDSLYKIREASLKSGLKVNIVPSALYGDTMSSNSKNQQSYLDMIWYNAQTIFTHLNEAP